MRTSVTLDPENEKTVRALARSQGLSLSRAINELLSKSVAVKQTPNQKISAAGFALSPSKKAITENEIEAFLNEEN